MKFKKFLPCHMSYAKLVHPQKMRRFTSFTAVAFFVAFLLLQIFYYIYAKYILNELAGRLGGAAGKLLTSFSSDLSAVREDHMESSSILFNQTENEKEMAAMSTKLSQLENLLHEKDKIIEDISKGKLDSDFKLNQIKIELIDKITEIQELAQQCEYIRAKYTTDLAKCRADHEIELCDFRAKISHTHNEHTKEKEMLISSIGQLNVALKCQQTVTKDQFDALKLVTTSAPADIFNALTTTEHNLTVLMSPLSSKKLDNFPKTAKMPAQPRNLLLLTDEARRILLDQIEKAKQVLRNAAQYVEYEKARRGATKRSTVSTQIDTGPQKPCADFRGSGLPDFDLTSTVNELKLANHKLERYGKLLKGKYRRLQVMYRETASQDRNDGQRLCKKLNFDDDFERLFVNRTELDEVVRKLEENNEILAKEFEQHGKYDEEQKILAQKYKELKKKRQTGLMIHKQ